MFAVPPVPQAVIAVANEPLPTGRRLLDLNLIGRWQSPSRGLPGNARLVREPHSNSGDKDWSDGRSIHLRALGSFDMRGVFDGEVFLRAQNYHSRVPHRMAPN